MDINLDLDKFFTFWGIAFLIGFLGTLFLLKFLIRTMNIITLALSLIVGVIFLAVAMVGPFNEFIK